MPKTGKSRRTARARVNRLNEHRRIVLGGYVCCLKFTYGTRAALPNPNGKMLVGELVQMTERQVRRCKGMTRSNFREIMDCLRVRRLRLGMKFTGWHKPDPLPPHS